MSMPHTHAPGGGGQPAGPPSSSHHKKVGQLPQGARPSVGRCDGDRLWELCALEIGLSSRSWAHAQGLGGDSGQSIHRPPTPRLAGLEGVGRGKSPIPPAPLCLPLQLLPAHPKSGPTQMSCASYAIAS